MKAERTRRESGEAVAASEAVALRLRTRLQRSRRIAAGFAVLGVVAFTAAIISFVQFRHAEDAKRQAQAARAAAEVAKQQAQAASAAAKEGAQRATKARAEAEKLIGFMTYDLRDKLRPIGRLDMLDAVYARVRAYYDAFGSDIDIPEIFYQRGSKSINQGDLLIARGDLSGALQNYRDALALDDKLAKQNPGNTDWQHQLSISYERVGDVLSDQGDLPGALQNYRDALAIRDKLTKDDPSKAGWQRDLSVSYEKVGDGLSAQGDLPGALKNYRDSLANRDQLTKEDPSNAGWQRDLSVSYEKTGEVLRAQGDLPGALKNYRETLAIRDKLGSQYPGNAGWQRDLAFSYFRIGTTLEDRAEFEERRE